MREDSCEVTQSPHFKGSCRRPNIRAFPMLHFLFPFSFPFHRAAVAAADPAQLSATHPPSARRPENAFALHKFFCLTPFLHVCDIGLRVRNCEVFRCAFYTTLVDYCKTHFKWSQPQCDFHLKAKQGNHKHRWKYQFISYSNCLNYPRQLWGSGCRICISLPLMPLVSCNSKSNEN